jgi:hypothetical protein
VENRTSLANSQNGTLTGFQFASRFFNHIHIKNESPKSSTLLLQLSSNTQTLLSANSQVFQTSCTNQFEILDHASKANHATTTHHHEAVDNAASAVPPINHARSPAAFCQSFERFCLKSSRLSCIHSKNVSLIISSTFVRGLHLESFRRKGNDIK